MKKVKTIIASVFVLGILCINLSIVSNNTSGQISLASLKQALAYDIEEVGIICSTGGQGLCYEECNWREESGRIKCDCRATGDPDDYCIKLV